MAPQAIDPDVQDLINRTLEHESQLGKSARSKCLPGWINTFGQKFLKGEGYTLSPNAVSALLHTLIAAREREVFLSQQGTGNGGTNISTENGT